MKKSTFIIPLLSALCLLAAGDAFAASAGMPWEGPLSRLASSLTGPVARVGGIAAIVIVGLGFAFSEGGGGLRKVLWVVAGLTIAFNAVGWALPFLGFSGGLAV
jgi:type IV secretory pathway VirB2 component (pilin)